MEYFREQLRTRSYSQNVLAGFWRAYAESMRQSEVELPISFASKEQEQHTGAGKGSLQAYQ